MRRLETPPLARGRARCPDAGPRLRFDACLAPPKLDLKESRVQPMKRCQPSPNAMKVEMNFCSQCGATLPPSARFCANCGTEVDGDRTPPTEQSNDPSDQRAVGARILASLPAADLRESVSIRCPTCQSFAVQRQSTTKRVAKVVAFGVFAFVAASKTFKCTACGYTW